MITVSIITPCYNPQSELLDTIKSIQTQSYKAYEHIIIDDCSTKPFSEELSEIIDNDPKIVFIKRSWNAGPVTRNRGISEAKGKYIAFLDADSFGCDESRVLVSGYPRNDYLFNTDERVLEKVGIDRKLYRHILLWMPTYRKTITGSHSDSDLFESEIPLSTIHNINNLQNLAKLLEEKNILLVIKPHPYCILNNQDITSKYSHIKQITNSDLNYHKIVNYSFVALFDGLITDYSSILFDYLLLDKPIAFTIEDIEQYKDTRGMNFPDPLELMAGDHLSNFDDMYRYIESFDGIVKNEYKDKTQSLRNQFHYIQNDTATETLLHLIGLKK